MPRSVVAFFVLFFAVLSLAGACSESGRYRVLSFFLDGVPPPGQPLPTAEPGPPAPGAEPGAPQPQAPPRVQQYYAHAPYRDNRCGGCHDIESGQMVKSVEEGLCLNCHSALVKDVRFVHGPAAVNACTECHHPHAAPFPKLLLVDPTQTCLNCHDRDDLSTGEPHSDLDRRSCVECHDPHGGTDRYFLKRGNP